MKFVVKIRSKPVISRFEGCWRARFRGFGAAVVSLKRAKKGFFFDASGGGRGEMERFYPSNLH